MDILRKTLTGLAVLAVAVAVPPKISAADAAAVAYFSHTEVDAAFAKSGILIGGEAGKGNYKVLTAHRDHPGEAEIHNLDTDIIYVVSGTATFVTGGNAVAAKTTEPNELRGKSIQGGTVRHLTKGDVIIIPPGIPHWFSEVPGRFLYFVVKVR